MEAAEGYPVDVDLETQGFYRCNDAGTLPGECADFISTSIMIKLNDMETANKLIYKQTNYFKEDGEEYRIIVTVSLDDDCHNNMCDWSITADIRWKINVDNTRSIWEAAATMKLRSMFQNWQIHTITLL